MGRAPSRREYNMFRGLIDRDKERVHRLSELLCQRFAAPIKSDLVEARALQARRGASKNGAYLTHSECVVFSFLETSKRAGMLDRGLKALAEAQLLDSNLRLGLSNVKLPPLKFLAEVFGDCDSEPLLLVEKEARKCKVALLEKEGPRRVYAIHWSPLLSECVARGGGFGSLRRTVSAVVTDDSGKEPVRISRKDASPVEWRERIVVTLDPRRLFYGFSKRKEIEVDAGIPAPESTATETELVLRAIGRRLDSLHATKALFRKVAGSSPANCIWPGASRIAAAPENSCIAVGTRKKASAFLIAADMQHFAGLRPAARLKARTAVRLLPIDERDRSYAAADGLLVPSEFSTISGADWKDSFNLALLILEGASKK